MADQPRYRFGPLERPGFLMGLRGSQIIVLVSAAVVCILALHVPQPALAAGLAFLVALSGVGGSFYPVGGRTPEQWAPLVGSFLLARFRGQHRFTSVAPLTGRTRAAEPSLDQPEILAGITVIAAPVSGGELGVIKDATTGTYAAVISVRGRSFALLDQHAKARLLDEWADVIAGLGREGSPVSRMQWIERTVADTGDGPNQYLREAMAIPRQSSPAASYMQLVDEAGPVSQHHETFVVVQIDAARGRRQVKQAGGGDDGACTVLAREAHGVATRLIGADLEVMGLLTPRLVAEVIRVAYDPAARRRIVRRGVDDPEMAGVTPDQAWPQATHTSWDTYRTDSAVHATYWCAEWPRIDVGPDFLAPLLLQTWVQRSVSVTLEPVSALRAQREVEHARTTDLADAEIREKAGFLTTMRRQREEENVARREQELADGHADVRFSGYITVTAADLDELEVACAEIEQQAGQARLVLRRMSAEQDIAFTYTLPLCRGLR